MTSSPRGHNRPCLRPFAVPWAYQTLDATLVHHFRVQALALGIECRRITEMMARFPLPTYEDLVALPTDLLATSIGDLLTTLQLVEIPIEVAAWASRARHFVDEADAHFEDGLYNLQQLSCLQPNDNAFCHCLGEIRRSFARLLTSLRGLVRHCDTFRGPNQPASGGENISSDFDQWAIAYGRIAGITYAERLIREVLADLSRAPSSSRVAAAVAPLQRILHRLRQSRGVYEEPVTEEDEAPSESEPDEPPLSEESLVITALL